MPKGNGQNNNEEEKDTETVSVNNSEADEEEEKTEEQIDNEEDIDNDNDDGNEDENEEEKSEEPQDEDDKLTYEKSYVPADKAMILRETYVKKLEETVDNYMLKKNKGNPNWKARTTMGEKRYEAAQNLKQFVNEYKEKYKLTHAISKPEYNQIVSNELNGAEWQERIKIAVNNGAKPDSEQVQGEKADELIKCVTGYLAAFKLSKLVENNKMTAKEAKDNFVETARNIALSGSFNRLLADAKGSNPWEVALNIQEKAMKNKGAQIYNDYMKISNKMENELKGRPSEVGKKTEIVKQDNSLKKLN